MYLIDTNHDSLENTTQAGTNPLKTTQLKLIVHTDAIKHLKSLGDRYHLDKIAG